MAAFGSGQGPSSGPQSTLAAWHLLTVLALIPRPLRDWAYDVLARRRYRLFGRLDACPVPPPDVRDSFLD